MDTSSKPVSEKKRKRRTESSAGIVVHIPTPRQKTSQPYHIPTPSPMYRNDFMGGSSPLPHPDMYQNGSGMQQFGQNMNPYGYGHLGMQPMSMPPHGMAPPYPATQYYNPPPPPHPGFIPNHGNTGYPIYHPYYHHSVTPQFAQPQFHGPVSAEVRDETTNE